MYFVKYIFELKNSESHVMTFKLENNENYIGNFNERIYIFFNTNL